MEDGAEGGGDNTGGEREGVAGCSNSIFLLDQSWVYLYIEGRRTRSLSAHHEVH